MEPGIAGVSRGLTPAMDEHSKEEPMPLRFEEYDGIVIGAGHNGMITAGYLGKSGLKVAVSEKDAATFQGVWRRWQPVVTNIVFPETYAPPVPIDEKRQLFEKTEEGREYLRYFDTTPEEFILAHFEHPKVQAFIGFLGVM